jgi:antitoxin Phd
MVDMIRVRLYMKWQIQQAKTHLSELIERARSEGPQVITRRGVEQAVVLSIEQYKRLVAHKPELKAHLLSGPKVEQFSVKRSRDTGRTMQL